MSNYLYHNKYHRTIHHTLPTPGIPDSATDPIASLTDPFLGYFHNYIDSVFLDEVGINVSYLVTYGQDEITTFAGLSVATLDSIFLTLTASAYSHSYNWYSTRTNIFSLSTGYSLYPFLTGVTIYLSGNWDSSFSAYTNIFLNSANYTSTYTTVRQNSANWPFLETTLRLDRVQQNLKSKNFALVNITSDTNIFWDLSSQQVAFFVLSSNSILKNIINPENKKKGGEYTLIIRQDGYGGRTLTFESDYRIMAVETIPIFSTELVNFPTKEVWTSSYYGSGYWIAVPYNSYKAARSDDGGYSWYGVPLPEVKNWRSIVYGMSAWIVVGDSLSAAARSTDGINFNYVSLLANRQWSTVGFGDNTFIALASGSNRGVKSTNGGLSWTEITLPITSNWCSIKYGDNTWIAVGGGGYDGQTLTDQGIISYDNGDTWDIFSLPSTRKWSDIAYGEDYWVAVAKDSATIALSSRLEGSGVWFDYILADGPSEGFSSVTHGNDTFVAASLDPDRCIFTSVDGKIWSYLSTPSAYVINVNYGGTSLNGSFMLVGRGEDDQSTYTNNRLIANDGPAMSTQTNVLTSAHGVTVIRFISDGSILYGIPSIYYIERGPVWTYFSGPGITLNPNPTDLFVGEFLIPSPGITAAGSVVVSEGYTNAGGFLILSGIPVP